MSFLPHEGAIAHGGRRLSAETRREQSGLGSGPWGLRSKVWGPACPSIWPGHLALGPIREIKGRLDSAAS